MTVKDYALGKIMEILEHKCPVVHKVPQRKIYYPVGSLNTVMSDITDPLLALYYHFAEKEDSDFLNKVYAGTWVADSKYRFIKDPKKKVYISGKITGLDPKEYRNAFNSAELFLKGLGYDVVNPVSYTENPKWKWADYMKRDIKLLMDCDCICMLNGWEGSRGALMEHEIACKLGMKILLLDENGVVV